MASGRNDRFAARAVRALAAASILGGAGCGSDDEPPETPTWGDVEPILRAECTNCHGASANTTGGGIRFDFYDMQTSPCGEAATVLGDMGLARVQADSIAMAITTTDPNVRPSMPPLPAPYLTDNEWLTILRWTAFPIRGDKPEGNRAPAISVDASSYEADQTLDVNVVVTDPDGDPVVGVLTIGDQVRKMDRAGAFFERLDTSSWPTGTVTISAVLCDGWSQVSSALRTIAIKH